MAFVRAIQNRVSYVEMMKSCTAVDKYANMISESVGGILQLTSCTKSLSPEDAIEVKPMLEKVFNAPAVFTLMEAINGKVKLGGACPEARQKHRFLDNYMTTALWKTFDDKHGIQNNLMAMAKHMVNMGLDGKVAPLDEKTIAFASAIATRAAGFDAATLLGYNRDLKTYIVALTKMHTAPSLDGRRSNAPLDYQRKPTSPVQVGPNYTRKRSPTSQLHPSITICNGRC